MSEQEFKILQVIVKMQTGHDLITCQERTKRAFQFAIQDRGTCESEMTDSVYWSMLTGTFFVPCKFHQTSDYYFKDRRSEFCDER